MNTVLKKFVNESLFDASAALLGHLHIVFNEVTRMPVPFESLYPQQLTKALQDVLVKVENTYFIGTVDESSLSGHAGTLDAADVTGRASDGKYTGMMVFAVELHSGSTLTRSESAILTRGFNRIASAQPVILFIKQGDELALSTCERSAYTQQWRDGEKLGKVSILRGIKCLNPHRGHIDILNSIGDKAYPNYEELYKHWMEVFSSDLLTQKFYSELSDWYAWAVQVARFPNDLTTDADDEKFNHESCIRLITRLIFVWFLKQKHLIPEEFFDERYIKDHFIEEFNPHDRKNLLYNPEESKYYRLILQNLFFAMLNCPIVAEGKDTPNNRRFRGDFQKGFLRDGYNVNNLMRYKADFKKGGADEFVQMANSHVPFLNGGLFDCLDKKPEKLYYDGFSERKESLEQLYLPDWLFFGDEVGRSIDLSQWYGDNNKKSVSARGIIDILKRYNFTIEENTPLDQEVSLDPELLGKAFENLLASYNPETKTSARKQTGSFYTPREIVQYMVDESLVAHLKRACGDDLEPEYRKLLSYSTEETTLNEEQRKAIMRAVYNCRVLDPACGSGAFPMGILQQLVHVLRQLDPANEMWKDFMIDIAIEQSKLAFAEDEETERKARLADIEEAFNTSVNDPDYARKLYLIEHCIYGVDIQPIAVQISKLRFFISLVVDQKPTSDATNNFGIRPLPNLESKFVAANTLIPVGYDASLFDTTDEIRSKKTKLKELNHQIFLAKRNVDKQRLKEEIKETRHELAKAIEDTGFVSQGAAQLLACWDMFDQNSSSPFFDAEWMFGVKNGFDIVIGNPPYIRVQNLSHDTIDLYKSLYETAWKRIDISTLFIECLSKSLAKNGVLCYISSNQFLSAEYGRLMRRYLLANKLIYKIVDFADLPVFENAITYVSVFMLRNTAQDSFGYFKVPQLPFVCPAKFTSCFYDEFDDEPWSFVFSKEKDILKKIQSFPPLINFAYAKGGIISGNDSCYIFEKDSFPAENEIGLDLIRTDDIQRYYMGEPQLKIFYPCKLKEDGSTVVMELEEILSDFPSAYSHIMKNEKTLKSRKDSRNTMGDKKNWYQPVRFGTLKLFKGDKILGPGIVNHHKFFVDETGYAFSFGNMYAIVTDNQNISLRVLLGLLNSKLIEYYLHCVAPIKQGGYYSYGAKVLEKIPINYPLGDTHEKILSLVSEIINSKKIDKTRNTLLAESEIDRLVYHLYGLTYDEVLIVDPETPITREEYESK